MFTSKARYHIYPPLVSNNSYVKHSVSQKHLELILDSKPKNLFLKRQTKQ